MMGFWKSVHGLLGFRDPDDRCRGAIRRHRGVPPPPNAAGLRCVAGHLPAASPPHVVESAAALRLRAPTLSSPTSVMSSPLSSPSSSATACPPSSPSPSPSPSSLPRKEDQPLPAEWIDDGTRGLSYLYGCGGHGRLELCTESLGFESCCDGLMGAEEKRAEQEIRRRIEEAVDRRSDGGSVIGKRRPASRRRTEAREFPPPLTWMRDNDERRRRTFLKAARKDGRFVLTMVRVETPEILRASRRGGHLRLELAKPEAGAAAGGGKETPEMEEPVAGMALGMEGGESAPADEAAAMAEAEGEESAAREEEETRRRLPTAALDGTREGGGGFRAGRCQEAAREGSPLSPFWSSRFATAVANQSPLCLSS